MSFIWSDTIVQMYQVKHPNFEPQRWHVFVTYTLSTWLACFLVCFYNSGMPHLNTFGMVAIIVGFFITVVVLAVMPGHDGRPPHASSSFVWSRWVADTGFSNGFVFVGGMLNGAYSVGCADVITHMAEEITHPERNIPRAMAFQYGIGFLTGFCYLIAILYAINDYSSLLESSFPIAEIYRQGTGSASGAIGLLVFLLVCIGTNMCGLYIASGRTLWTLARDGAAPFPMLLGRVNKKLEMPFISTIVTAVVVTALGCIYVGNSTAFNAFIGTYVLMSSSSYIAAILPHLLTARKHVARGYFYMPGIWGYLVNAVGCVYMIVWFLIYCFPFSLPVTAQNMNYASAIWGGCTILVGLWWILWARHGYGGPTQLEYTQGVRT